ncbi:redoxin domain-containing protein [Bacillus mangrovi]|uniref:thioredoxin-dependent peroxiredoxin n=1 Tax=Metabacillus mangrovi TaxID=1491830 RepID=A0A7X2S299_9BACI|nr:peroxiredoxin-like family protein [Metabacillus mangrovi]MTH51955.1 redoxin domain-containing protein [Metabacillus mangrovi]
MTAMRTEFKEYLEKFKESASAETQADMQKAIDDLENSEEGKGLELGDQIPDFVLPDASGKKVSIANLLKKGPVVITFYRGGWCPYCNLELKGYESVLSEIHEAGAELIAISPETPDASLSTKEKNELTYHVLSDEGNVTAKQFNLVYQMPEYLIELYKEKDLDVPGHNGDESWTLPVSGTFIADQTGHIIYSYVKADYKDRAEPSEVVSELKKINR